MEFLRETRLQKIDAVEAFLEIYPQDERALKHSLQICAKKCVKFDESTLNAKEKACFNNCLWKFGQVLSREY